MRTNIFKKIGVAIVVLIGLYFFISLICNFPIPRGSKVNGKYYTYYKNPKGIYYISVENLITLINCGRWAYLKDVDESSFTVLDDNWAKDANHVWYTSDLIENIDAKTFHINSSGVPVDKDNVYLSVFTGINSHIRPVRNEIDVKTAEYFVYRLDHLQSEWIRDKDFVYYHGNKIDVDRNSFHIIGADWFMDRDFIYRTKYNNKTEQWDLLRVDSAQIPIEAGYSYLRNGRNIIYLDSVIARDIDVHRFEEIGANEYLVNDMLFFNGKPYLKDSLDVKNTKFYYHGHIAVDNDHVFYGRNRLDDVDAATFRQIDNESFEDANFKYKIKNRAWNEDYPFEKKEKRTTN